MISQLASHKFVTDPVEHPRLPGRACGKTPHRRSQKRAPGAVGPRHSGARENQRVRPCLAMLGWLMDADGSLVNDHGWFIVKEWMAKSCISALWMW